MSDIAVAVIRESALITDAEVQAAVAALQKQVTDDFKGPWGITASVEMVPDRRPAAGSWWLVILDDADQAGALGYHDLTDAGLPIGKVFAKTTRAAGGNWTVTASHELLEMLADPAINLSACFQDGDRIVFYAYEVCDACEGDEFGYSIGSTLVSDFVYPAWFESFHQPRSVQFDRQNRITSPFQLLGGGYANVLDASAGGGWRQVMAEKAAQSLRARPAVGSRRERRRTPRGQWLRSAARSKAPAVAVSLGRGARLCALSTGAAADLTLVQPSGSSISVQGQLEKAIQAVSNMGTPARPAPDTRDTVLKALQEAQKQANTAAAKALNGDIPDDLHLSLALSAVSSRRRDGGPIRALDLLGPQQYEELDPGWIGSFYHYLASERVAFPTHISRNINPVVRIRDKVALAIAGDWGTGDSSSRRIAEAINSVKADHTIHLGDVYYSGTSDEELERFVGLWPAGSDPSFKSFSLNSNHEMYSGGAGYFNVVLTDPQFSGQQGLSYFAMENSNWLILGLDSAYFAHNFLYQHGVFTDDGQVTFARNLATAARGAGKRVIVMTHHQGLNLHDDSGNVTAEDLWQQMIGAVGGDGPDYWYWGHVHAGIAFQPGCLGAKLRARCVGHGGIPYAPFDQKYAQPTVNVAWAETVKAGDPDEPRRALNGFAVLRLDGKQITEELRDENGQVRWQANN
jgi:calcineurin-like phosphoesterase family protein